jgi:hypothetical protein
LQDRRGRTVNEEAACMSARLPGFLLGELASPEETLVILKAVEAPRVASGPWMTMLCIRCVLARARISAADLISACWFRALASMRCMSGRVLLAALAASARRRCAASSAISWAVDDDGEPW